MCMDFEVMHVICCYKETIDVSDQKYFIKMSIFTYCVNTSLGKSLEGSRSKVVKRHVWDEELLRKRRISLTYLLNRFSHYLDVRNTFAGM